MELDASKGRPTELETFVGAVVRLAEDAGISVPLYEKALQGAAARIEEEQKVRAGPGCSHLGNDMPVGRRREASAAIVPHASILPVLLQRNPR